MAELIEATSFPPHRKLLETFGFISLLHPLTVLKYSNGNDWPIDNANVLLKMAVISSLSCASEQSDVKEIFPIRSSRAKFALVSPLGMRNVDADEKGKHTTSLV